MQENVVENGAQSRKNNQACIFKRVYRDATFSDYAFPVSPTMRCRVNLLSVAISMNQLYFCHR